jgi:hypothetical protein
VSRGRPAGTVSAREVPEMVDHGPSVKRGDWVVCRRSWPTKGSFRRYAEKIGRCVIVNRDELEYAGKVYYEYGVRFNEDTHDIIWFVDGELMPTSKPKNAPDIRLRSLSVPA